MLGFAVVFPVQKNPQNQMNIASYPKKKKKKKKRPENFKGEKGGRED